MFYAAAAKLNEVKIADLHNFTMINQPYTVTAVELFA